MKIVGYYVLKGGVPCAFRNIDGMKRAGILVPITDPAGKDKQGKPLAAAFMDKPRDARRAIRRSESCIKAITAGENLISEWMREQIPSYYDSAAFETLPLAKQ